MVMTHYMELLSLHSPWFLILFMLVDGIGRNDFGIWCLFLAV